MSFNSFHLSYGGVVFVFCVVTLLAIFRKTVEPKLNINLDPNVFSGSEVRQRFHSTKLLFHLVGSGISQMIDANRDGAIETTFRTRKIPIAFEFGGRKLTLIIDARNYDASNNRMIGMLSFFEEDFGADFRNSSSDVEAMGLSHE